MPNITKKIFNTRMESAIRDLEIGRGWVGILGTFTLFPFSFLLYMWSFLYEPGNEQLILINYCQNGTIWGCFDYFALFGRFLFPVRWIPWSLLIQTIIFLIGFINYYLSWIFRGLHWWKSYWITAFLFRFSLVCVFVMWCIGLINLGTTDYRLREIISLCSLVSILFIFTLPYWNKKFLDSLEVFNKIGLILGALGGGGAVLGFFLGRYFIRNNLNIPIFIMGLIGDILCIIICSKRMAEYTWNGNPWRLEKEIMAKESGEDVTPWEKIKINGL